MGLGRDNRVFLDTNAVIAVLSGHKPLLRQLNKASWLRTSVISHIEFLSFPNLSDENRALFGECLKQLNVLGVDESNDAIIAATAIHQNADLVTADREFRVVSELRIVQF